MNSISLLHKSIKTCIFNHLGKGDHVIKISTARDRVQTLNIKELVDLDEHGCLYIKEHMET